MLHRRSRPFLKLVHVSIFETRQTEFAKEIARAPQEGLPVYGNGVVGPPGDTTTLRSWSTADPARTATRRTPARTEPWVRGGTWTHGLHQPEIGLVSMGGEGFTAEFLDVAPGSP